MGIKKTLGTLLLGVGLLTGGASKAKADTYSPFAPVFENLQLMSMQSNPHSFRNRGTYITRDGQKMLITRMMGESGPERVYESTWDLDNSIWTEPTLTQYNRVATMGPDDSTVYHGEGMIYESISGDIPGRYISEIGEAFNSFFTGERLYYSKVINPEYTKTRIYYSDYNESTGLFGTPQALPELTEGGNVGLVNYISPDHQTMLFSSDRSGTVGSYDIWKASWNGSSWGEITNMNDLIQGTTETVNTPYADYGSYYCPSTRMLYFNRDTSHEIWQAQGIPEPVTLGLLAAGGLAGLLGRKRKK